MKSLRDHVFLRGCAMVLCVVCIVSVFWSGLLLLFRWDDIWSGGNFFESNSSSASAYQYHHTLYEVMRLKAEEDWGRELSYSQRTSLAELEEEISQAKTNACFQVRNEADEVAWSNLGNRNLSDMVQRSTQEIAFEYGDEYYNNDQLEWVQGNAGEYQILQADTPEGTVKIDPTEIGFVSGEFNQYGYQYISEEQAWNYDREKDSRYHYALLTVDSGIDPSLSVQDNIYDAREDYQDFQRMLTPVTIAFLVPLAIGLLLMALLCAAAGYQKGGTGLVLKWYDRIPYDLYVVFVIVCMVFILNVGDPISYSLNRELTLRAVVGIGILSLMGAWLGLAGLLTTVVRIKTRTILRNTVIWRSCVYLVRQVSRIAANWPMTRRAVGVFVLYLLGTIITTPTIIFIPVYQGIVLWAICRWVRQWNTIRGATTAIIKGEPEVKIDSSHMWKDLKEHAEQLNALGTTINNEVEERLKSERFKAELITNVSHDLKTPLTSIINYVDLLKKIDIQEPKALEYLEVLDRKSQRLKKLTEDLVEASKASTGTLPVNLAQLDFAQLVSQAMGEYEEKFRRAELTPVVEEKEEDFIILGDGRHLWRVIDNLLGNCCKYAMPGTRVYLDLVCWDGKVILTIKNISKNPLNVPAEQLMERFVRGESSRTTEGTGLGLSIARSLTELQGGTFRLNIDGDLFKVMVSIPAAPKVPSIP